MSFLIFIYYILIILIGAFCLGCLFTIYLNNKNEAFKIHLLFYFALTVFMISIEVRGYLEMITSAESVLALMAAFQFLAVFSALLILAFLLNKVFLVPFSFRMNIILTVFTCVVFILSVLEQFIFIYGIDEAYYVIMLAFYITVFFKYRKNVVNEKLKRIMKFVYIITMLFTPGIILDDIIYPKGVHLIFYPMFYIFVGLYSVYSFYRVGNSIQNEKYHISNDFIQKYGITERETEVLKLLLKGCSYQKVADELVISISTVRTHVNNIYKKTSVNSRYEIYNLIV